MSLFGAMTSGVSGLVAQSSAMAAISDNIANVNTIGYKNTEVDFQSLVTKQALSTEYAAGGVQSRPRGANGVQGLLQATTSQTDIAVSGDGFFVVNQSSQPGAGDQFLFTRAGSFHQDSDGYLRNTAGYYLQAWPTDALGNVVLPAGSTASIANQNIISTDFLQTINLNRIGGSATATSKISIGANLPANDANGTAHTIDVQFYDTLGNANQVSFAFTKADSNEWDVAVDPPSGTSAVMLYNASGGVYRSVGQLEFTTIPTAGQTVDIGGTTYTFVTSSPGADEISVASGRTVAQVVADLSTAVNANTAGASSVKSDNASVLLLNSDSGAVAVDATGIAAAVQQIGPFTLPARTSTTSAITFNAAGQPSDFNVAKMAVIGFVNGAADMNDTVDLNGDGAADVKQIALDFGTAGELNGFTQLAGKEFTTGHIEQNGARFGTFTGVTISPEGLMVALFDNGDQRPIYRVPVATFVNLSGLASRNGNVWNATDASGAPTLRAADSGPAGQINQASLESSTVDLGEEFTNMIVVQRAYSAATRIISTADQMLDELMRVKR